MDPKEDTTQNNAAEEEAPISQDENSKSQSSAADLAARREARRRKILENSNNRLTKLTGREHKDAPQFEGNRTTGVLLPYLQLNHFPQFQSHTTHSTPTQSWNETFSVVVPASLVDLAPELVKVVEALQTRQLSHCWLPLPVSVTLVEEDF